MVRGITISCEVRKLIIQKHLNGDSSYKIAKFLERPRSSVQNVITLFKKTNSVIPKKKLGRVSKLTPAKQRALKYVITKHRRTKIGELACKLEATTGCKISPATSNRWLKSIGYGHYKVIIVIKNKVLFILILLLYQGKAFTHLGSDKKKKIMGRRKEELDRTGLRKNNMERRS